MTTLARAGALWLALAATPLASIAPSATPSPLTTASPAARNVVGQLLALQDGYLVFTTGDAVRVLPDAPRPARLRLGALVRVRLDPVAHAIAAIAYARTGAPGDLDAQLLPREYVAVSPKSARTQPPAGSANSTGGASAASVTIDLRVPDSTPLGDDVYLATDRSNFSASEVRMLRVDARRFSVSLRLATGSQLRYEFTRGNFSSIERDRLGGIVDPRSVDVRGDTTLHDSVARWADVN